MKNSIIAAASIFFLCISNLLCIAENSLDPTVEFYFINRITDEDLYVRFYPIGAIFNGEANLSNPTRYSILGANVDPQDPNSGFQRKRGGDKIKHIIGLDGYALSHFHPETDSLYFKVEPSTNVSYDKWLLLGNDASANLTEMDGLFGYGNYMFEIYRTTNSGSSFELIMRIPIDWLDFNYPYISSTNGAKDLKIRIYSLEPLSLTFQWLNYGSGSNGEELLLSGTGSPPYNGGIQVYKQYHRYVNGNWEGYNLNGEHPPSRGNSVSDKYFLTFPIDGRDLPAPYTIPRHDSAGVFNGNLTIDTNVYTPDSLFESPTKIVMSKMTYLKVKGDDSLILSTPSYPQGGYVDLIIEDSSILDLRGKIIIEDRNKLTLKSYSFLRFQLGSAIIVKPGAVICNEGAEIKGPLNFLYEKGTHLVCPIMNDFVFKDSSRIILLDSAELIFPDDYTLHLKGNETALILNPGSKLLFGENSGIVCDSGARLIANDATFASADSTKKWNGISLNDLASDTIKNCTIKNAMYGIMISDRYSPDESSEPYSAEISGCSFVNQTSQVLNNAIYLQNSAHVLLKDNTITSNNLSVGFTHGIYAEYCPGEMLNIINNSISNCNNGMTVIQSSPYIAFNTINGNSYGESGVFLDNSNGTIKYNVISDFYNSYYSFYSSPDLLKNTFDNSCDDNVYLSSSSVPVMHPLISGGSTYWFAGDNLITGSPSDAGILFDSDAMPDLNCGYNRIVLQGSSYYINGINPTGGTRDFYAVKNYWHDNPPDSSKFNVTNAISVIYSPYDNNSTSARATNNLQLDTIGFGMYDTLHFYESDNPNSAQELFLLAYQSEFNGEYEEAIGYYKEIVSDYKDSSNASSCLARVFNCYEKKQTTVTEYTLLENYYSAIAGDTTHTVIMRNISEDLAIQSNIKQGNIEEAISDYDEIHASHTNTPKGFHALINKEILSAVAGDNLSSGSTFDEIEFKQIKINALLKGLNTRDAKANFSSNSNPLSFNLSQNYPNPFNPVTTINYDLPSDGIVTLKVYDILGRELKTLVNEMKTAGYHKIQFNVADLASGAYFYRMTAGNFVAVKKFVVLK